MLSGYEYFDLALTLGGLGLSAWALGTVLNLTGRSRRFWLGFMCFTIGGTLGTLSWLTAIVPAAAPLGSYFIRGPLLVVAFVLILRNAPLDHPGPAE